MVRKTNLIANLLVSPAATMARVFGVLIPGQKKKEPKKRQLKEKSITIEREDKMENLSREVIENLLNKTVGEVRAYLAFEEADTYLKDVLLEEADFDEEIGCDYDEDCEEYDEDECWDEEDNWDDEEEYEDEEEYDGICSPLENPEEEVLAQNIANDILDGKYTIATIRGLYSTDLVKRVADLI